MSWLTKPTGDMTLSIVDENGFQILKVDMLSQRTMQAGLNGSRLVQALNDLTIIAGFSEGRNVVIDGDLPFEDEGYSPKPWSVLYNERTKTLKVCSGGRKICERQFPASTPKETIESIHSLIQNGIEKFNVEDV